MNAFNQIIIRITDIEQTESMTESIRQKFPDLEIMNWKELQPDLAMMTDYVHQIYGILMVIIMAALAFGIVNTMLMVVLERTKELGMLTAIGMNKRRVFSMIMLESVFLSVIGGVAGMIVGMAYHSAYSQKWHQLHAICGRNGGIRIFSAYFPGNQCQLFYYDDRPCHSDRYSLICLSCMKGS